MITPLGDRIVVEKVKEDAGYIPEHLMKDNLIKCIVLKTPQKNYTVSVSDVVLIPLNSLREVRIGDQTTYITNIRDVFAIID
jgi:co-chaperonin GroES (HSP10)